jgi:hypothetical protein
MRILSWSQIIAAQADTEVDYAAALEAGVANEHNSSGGSPGLGPALGIAVTSIENWFEIEVGLAGLRSAVGSDLSGDVIFKKPFRLSETAAFMFGLGPFVSRTVSGPQRDTAHGIEVAVDFMFWPRENIGWYVEPSWSRTSGTVRGPSVLPSGFYSVGPRRRRYSSTL